MRIVIALGGNAMTSPEGGVRVEDQQAAIASACDPVADLIAAGHEVLLCHGNGPQVGNLLLKNELSAAVVPPVPLDWCVAQTQATIGFTIMNALEQALSARGHAARTATLVSRTLVDLDDPGFSNPTKPIGRYCSAEEAEAMRPHGQQFTEVPGRGWRRVVASPEPEAWVDAPAAEALLAAGWVVVCAGGGGIPVVRREDGRLDGVEAVIDKDLTAAVLARRLAADVLVVATDVDEVVRGWGSDDPRPVGTVTATRMRAIAAEERFAAGSMGPKVEAVTRFAEHGGTGIITSLRRIEAAVHGRAGTRVVPQDPTPEGTR